MSLGYVTLSKVVPCPFPSCYIPCSEILLPYSYGRQKGKGPSSVTALRLSRGIGPTSVLFSSVAQSVRLFGTPWTSAQQASLAITNSQRLLKLISIELVMPSSHLVHCGPILLLPSGSFPVSQFFASRGQSIKASASALVLPMNIQG